MCVWKASQIRHRIMPEKKKLTTNKRANECSCTTRNLVYSLTPLYSQCRVVPVPAEKENKKGNATVPFPACRQPRPLYLILILIFSVKRVRQVSRVRKMRGSKHTEAGGEMEEEED
jgi:hypothetical protein